MLKFKNITAFPQTANEPLAVLRDGKLAENYGSVFKNGVVDGIYEIDLGKDVRGIEYCCCRNFERIY